MGTGAGGDRAEWWVAALTTGDAPAALVDSSSGSPVKRTESMARRLTRTFAKRKGGGKEAAEAAAEAAEAAEATTFAAGPPPPARAQGLAKGAASPDSPASIVSGSPRRAPAPRWAAWGWTMSTLGGRRRLRGDGRRWGGRCLLGGGTVTPR